MPIFVHISHKKMKITKLIIPNYRQFRDFEIDFTYPKGHEKEGQPLEKVCFIGKNGTGKSTLLNFIKEKSQGFYSTEEETPLILIKTKTEHLAFYTFDGFTLKEDIENEHNWIGEVVNFFQNGKETPLNEFLQPISAFLYSNGERKDLGIQKINSFSVFSPAESHNNTLLNVNDVPETSLNEALKLRGRKKTFHEVSQDRISDFWQQLIFSLKQREEAFQTYAEENSEKSYKQLREEFEEKHPDILKQLAIFWDKMLGKVGLYFDYESAKKPVQLTDNLLAYIKLKSTKATIPYNELSTGIRNFIFRLGHIFSLFFGQKIENGFLIVDEPENSLFPDFRYDLISIYQEIMAGSDTQFFVATHDPIIAAQFEPCERVILDFDEMGYVIAKKGVTPEGDDPNDILRYDFGIESLLGKKGVEMWERCVELKMEIRHTENPEEKERLLLEYMKISQSYHFPIN